MKYSSVGNSSNPGNIFVATFIGLAFNTIPKSATLSFWFLVPIGISTIFIVLAFNLLEWCNTTDKYVANLTDIPPNIIVSGLPCSLYSFINNLIISSCSKLLGVPSNINISEFCNLTALSSPSLIIDAL